MVKKYPRILYFINGSVPTNEDVEQSEKLGPNVCFRNAQFVPNEGSVERCDGVAGNVPALYSDLPKAEDAVESFVSKWRKSEKVVVLPPSSPETPPEEPTVGNDKPEEEKPVDVPPPSPEEKGKGASKQKPPAWQPNA